MSQQALLLLTPPEVVAAACRGWEAADSNGTGASVEEVLEDLATALPLALEITVPRGLGSLLFGQPPRYRTVEDGDQEYAVHPISDDDFDELCQLEGFENLRAYGDREARSLAGLEGFCFLYSY